MGVSVKINASDQRKLVKDIKNFSLNVGVKVERVVEDIALYTVQQASNMVPVDKGILKGSIRAEKKGKYTWEVATNSGYGLYIEFGEPTGTGPNGGPRPFLRPGFERAKAKAFAYLKREFKK